jgi:hypothetical protein
MSIQEMLAKVSAVASDQLSLFTREQAQTTAGLTNKHLVRLCQDGVIEKVAPSVFRFAASAPTWHQRVLAACLDGGPECVASHRTAATLHKFDGFEPGVIEVLVPMAVRMRRREVVVHHTRDLPPWDRTMVGNIPVTTPARTLIDLGGVVPADIVEEAFDGAERDRKVTRSQVERRYVDLRANGRTGIGAMTQLLPQRLSPGRVPWNKLERRFLRLMERAGLPAPTTKYKVRLPDGQEYELDFAWVEHRVGVEVDGHGAHAKQSQRAADNNRANDLADVDWSLRRFTYQQVMLGSPRVTRTVARALAKTA